jgi:hypothetical protein
VDRIRLGLRLPWRHLDTARLPGVWLELWAAWHDPNVSLYSPATLTFSTVLIGGILGAISNRHQEYLFRRSALKSGNNGRSPPEARLYWAAYGGLMFPLAMFVFAWTGRPWIPWAVPAVCLIIANWGIYSMYVGIL